MSGKRVKQKHSGLDGKELLDAVFSTAGEAARSRRSRRSRRISDAHAAPIAG